MKRNWQLGLYLALVFAAGMAVGALVHRFVSVTAVSATAPVPKSPEDFRRQYEEEMRTRLKLSPEQFAAMTKILDETRARFREVRERSKPEFKAIHDDQVAQINKILSVEQQTEYAQMRKERDERRKAMEKEKSLPAAR